mmetsp:Transcript_3792/g.7549  ORF Transcript_3792/g.7549 Transcript_3792/m.7549 type:complete len:379 (-) Transcript_3792:53-1189(-)
MTKPTLKLLSHNIQREISEKLRKGQRGEEWFDNQDAVDEVSQKITDEDHSTPRNIKVMESLSRPINCSDLFVALCGKQNVRSLSLVGVHLDENSASRLSETLRHPQTKIKVLQVWRFLPSCLASLCDSIKENKELREIRLTFHGNLNDEQTSMLLQALEDNQGLVAIKLFGVDLSNHAEKLASLVRNRQKMKELRLSRCRLSNVSGLAKAMATSKALEKVDLSMNELSSDADIALMLTSKSIKTLILSKNQLGKDDGSVFGKNLATNETLDEFFLEGNPLSTEFASSLLKALQLNVTLKTFGFMSSYMGKAIPSQIDTDIRNIVALNQAGRRWLRAASEPNKPSLELAPMAHLLHRTRFEPSSLFGVLREHTNLWVNP